MRKLTQFVAALACVSIAMPMPAQTPVTPAPAATPPPGAAAQGGDKAFTSAGGHFNPTNRKHGGPYSDVKHAGDLGNINFNAAGEAKFNFVVGDISVRSGRPNDIVGRALMVHAQADDLKTDPTGNAGGRVACGVIR